MKVDKATTRSICIKQHNFHGEDGKGDSFGVLIAVWCHSAGHRFNSISIKVSRE